MQTTPFKPIVAPVTPGDVIAAYRHMCLPDAAMVQVYRRYAAGDQPQYLSEQQMRGLEGLLTHLPCDNICHQIISVDVDRIEFEKFAVENDDAAMMDFLETFRVKAHVEAEEPQVNYAMARDGNHAIGVSWSASQKNPILFQEPWWDGNTGMFVAYGDDGQPAWAVKEWIAPEPKSGYPGVLGLAVRFRDSVLKKLGVLLPAEPLYRWRTLYYPDRIERYRQAAVGGTFWEQYQHYVSTDTGVPLREPWPVPWKKPDGTPLGLDVIHFPNASKMRGYYGLSELDGGVIGLQDQINDVHWDLTANGRMTGFQTAWIAGVPTMDDKGNAVTVEMQAGNVFLIPDPQGKADVLPAGDSNQLIAILSAKKQAASYMTSTPLYLITGGDWPSGEALLRAEAPLANKAKKQTNRLGPAWATVAHRATELANARGNANLNESLLITAVFADTSARDQMSQITIESAKLDLEAKQKAVSAGSVPGVKSQIGEAWQKRQPVAPPQ